MFPIEIDLDMVRRQRETGMKGLGQVLKSFRDREVEFPVYDRASGADAYLHTLGPLETPTQGSRAGLNDHRSAHRAWVRRNLAGAADPNFPVFQGKTGSD